MIGDEKPSPGTAVFHTMFDSELQWVGSPVSGEIPEPSSRQLGQLKSAASGAEALGRGDSADAASSESRLTHRVQSALARRDF